MTLKELIKLISERDEIINNPPVLLDLGASGSLNPIWKLISKFSIGVAFDADNRDFGFIENKTSSFKKMFVYNSIVTDKENEDKIKFYLTESPYCSSTLRPLTENLKQFHYGDLFNIKETVELKAKNISLALQEMGIKQIDWFKTDTQGTDLRLFKILPISIQSKCIITQFEPGFIDAYDNEDKIHHVLAYMETLNVKLYEFKVLGPLSIHKTQYKELFPTKIESKLAENVLKHSPGWAEISYINKFESDETTARDLILGWLFMMLEKQYANAYSIISLAKSKFPNDKLIKKIFDYSLNRIKKEIFNIRNYKQIISTIRHKLVNK